MPNFNENLKNTAGSSGLYCVWVPVEDERRGRLAAIWIDPAMTAFTLDGAGTAAAYTAGHQEDVDLLGGEHLASLLSRRS